MPCLFHLGAVKDKYVSTTVESGAYVSKYGYFYLKLWSHASY